MDYTISEHYCLKQYQKYVKILKRLSKNISLKLCENPSFIKFGSWIGGDRDGNPFVTPEITKEAVYMHAETAILEYIRRAQSLSTLLTHSVQLTNPSDDFIKSSQEDLKYLDGALEDSTQDFAKEPYRRKLKIVRYN